MTSQPQTLTQQGFCNTLIYDVKYTPLLSLWENKNKSQIFNCRYIKDLSIYFLTEWLKSRFLGKVLRYNHPRLFYAESDKRGIQQIASL